MVDFAKSTEASGKGDEVVAIHRLKVSGLLAEQLGKFVTLDFIKADGSKRTLNGRLGVRKHLRAGNKTVGFPDQSHLCVYDVQAKGYRAVNLSTVQRVRAMHTDFVITG